MDRLIVAPSQIVQDTDILSTNKNAMLGFGRLCQDLIGASVVIGGTPCVPGTGLAVLVGPGAIYSPQNVDNTPYGTLPADTTHQTVKQGILQSAVSLACPAPASAGQSIVYLIEGQFQETDAGQAVVPYYNSANPLQPFQGPLNNGLAQPTVRQGIFAVQVKAGAPAATGSQVAPAVDAGWTGLYVVTVANGQAAIGSGNISFYPATPFLPVGPFLSGRITPTEQALGVTIVDWGSVPGDVRRYGAKVDGSTDDYNALVTAFSCNAIVSVPPGTMFLSQGITVPSGKILQGAGVSFDTSNSYGTTLLFANGVGTCVTISNANLTTGSLKRLTVTRVGAPPAGSYGVKADRGIHIIMEDVLVRNHARLYYFYSQTTAGISAHMLNCFGDQFTENCFHIDSWPELYVTGGRFGGGADPDNPNAFIYITGTSPVSAGIGPNTLIFSQAHFNGKNNATGPAYWLEFDAVNVPTGNQVEFSFDQCHIEGVRTSVIKTTATAPFLNRVYIGGCVFNTTSAHFWDINAATAITEFEMNGAKVYCADFNLTNSSFINGLNIIGGEVIGNATITGPAGQGNALLIIGTFFVNTLTFNGTWNLLYVRCSAQNSSVAGADSFISSSMVSVEIGGSVYTAQQGMTRTYRSAGAVNGFTETCQTSRGTIGVPTISTNGDIASRYVSHCHDGTGFKRIGLTRWQVDGVPSGTSSPGRWILSTTLSGASDAPTDVITVGSDGILRPVTDNSVAIGNTGARWSAVWSANGTIQTSDERQKIDLQPVPGLDFVLAVASEATATFRWRIGGNKVIRQAYLDADGHEIPEDHPIPEHATPGRIITEAVPGKRRHAGFLAQKVKAIQDRFGFDFGAWILTDPNDPESEQGLRPDQMVPSLYVAVAQLDARLKALEAK